MKVNQIKAELTTADNKIAMTDTHSNRFFAQATAQKPITRAGEDKNDG